MADARGADIDDERHLATRTADARRAARARAKADARHGAQQAKLDALRPEPQLSAFTATASRWSDSRWRLPWTDPQWRTPAGSPPSQCVRHIQRIGGVSLANFRNGTCGYLLAWEEAARQPFAKPFDTCVQYYNTPTGLEDPRSIMWQGRPWVVVHERTRIGSMKGMLLIDISTGKSVKLWLNAKHQKQEQYWSRRACAARQAPPVGRCVEKNWSPFVWRGLLYFVYSMSPLSVVKLLSEHTGECRVTFGDLSYVRNETGVTVAGGSALLPFDGIDSEKLVGIAHAIESAPGVTLYRTVFVVLDAERNELHVGKQVEFPWPSHPLARSTIYGSHQLKDVQYPYELEIRGGQVRIGIEMNDCFSTWFTMGRELFASLLPG